MGQRRPKASPGRNFEIFWKSMKLKNHQARQEYLGCPQKNGPGPLAPDAPRRSKDDPRRLSDMIFERIIGPFCPLLSRQSAALDIQTQRPPFPPSPLHDLLGYYTAGCHRKPECNEFGRFKPGASTLSFFNNCEQNKETRYTE